ncbi:MAG: ribosome biogenesis GTPase Der [Candidatus Krumholzibacteriota bacterium]|nr:ribosome biogenesis GTPase Der [Candidatus Krumholzibacteriota bacterium]
MKRPPVVAIVGKPNSGKSTLFNRIVGSRLAIVHETPGVTRDTMQVRADWNGRAFDLVDTGGFAEAHEDPLQPQISDRIVRTAGRADVILFVADVDTGPTAEDGRLLKALREFRDRMILAVNKVEADADRWNVHEFHSLGIEPVFEVSALHGGGVGDLLDAIVERFPEGEVAAEDPALRVTIVGKPNVGKSSLVNSLLGEDRHIVSEEPGTTRDSIDIRIRWHDREILIVDTAGVKRKARTEPGLDVISSLKSLRSVRFADIVLVMLDATAGISRQDVRVAAEGHRARKGVAVLVNKWDLVEKNNSTAARFTRAVREEMAFLSYAPVLTISALTGQRLDRIFPLCVRIQEARNARISTSELNRVLETITGSNPPKFYRTGTGKIYYGTQTGVEPPTFTLFVNKAAYFPRSYIRYLNNSLRNLFTFEGTAITISLKSKER